MFCINLQHCVLWETTTRELMKNVERYFLVPRNVQNCCEYDSKRKTARHYWNMKLPSVAMHTLTHTDGADLKRREIVKPIASNWNCCISHRIGFNRHGMFSIHWTTNKNNNPRFLNLYASRNSERYLLLLMNHCEMRKSRYKTSDTKYKLIMSFPLRCSSSRNESSLSTMLTLHYVKIG